VETNRTDRRERGGQGLRELARRRMPSLLGAIIVGLAVTAAPALAQEDNCYPGLDCPDDIRRNAPPRAPSVPQQPQYQQRPAPNYGQPSQPYAYPSEPNYLQPGYSAEAYCSMTGVVGFSHRVPSPERALMVAVYDCIAKGGVPNCCYHGARLTE
jgi:hypothetical protein